ncbi:WD40 repeat domain-containing protein [Candidatus Villigracilis affinis]|uniref:WD40 repeat domain-containing protein n=1 Tax=Candidatus Villigracilis affinis TaxID=3140682 RepID=UPI002A1F7BDB|nr:WD40 repeat domain-containing protein [Anaerolineales bacterium]
MLPPDRRERSKKFENVPAIVFSSDSTRLITGDFDGYVQAWDVTNGELLLDLLSNETEIMSLASAADQLAVGLQDKLLILDVQTGDTIAVIDSPGDHQLMAFSQGGSLLAANNTSGQIYIWQKQGDVFYLLRNIPSEQATSMIFNPHGDRLLVGALNNVFVIDPFAAARLRGSATRIPSAACLFSGWKYAGDFILKAIQFWDMQKMSQFQRDDLIKAACNRLTQNFDAVSGPPSLARSLTGVMRARAVIYSITGCSLKNSGYMWLLDKNPDVIS